MQISRQTLLGLALFACLAIVSLVFILATSRCALRDAYHQLTSGNRVLVAPSDQNHHQTGEQLLASATASDNELTGRVSKTNKQLQQQQPRRCTTTGCLKMADYLANSIDYTTKPCDDFYQFACGRAIERAKLDGNSNANINIFDEAPKRVEQQLKQLLEDTQTFPSGTNKNLIRLRQYYQSCMNESHLVQLGIEPLRKLIIQLGGFPILGNTNKTFTSDDWLNLLIAFRNRGITENFLISLSIRPHYQNNSLATIYLEQPTLDLKEMLTETVEDDRRSDYRFMVASLVALGLEQFNEHVQAQLDEVYKFKTRLHNIMGSKDVLKVKHTQVNLGHGFEELNLARNFYKQFIVRMMQRNDLIPERESIQVDLDYLLKLDKLLVQTPAEVILNFMFYKLVHQLRNYLSVSVPAPDTWLEDKNCLTIVQEDLTLGLSHEYIKHFVSLEARQSVAKLVERIKTQTKELIDGAHWIKAPETRQIARDKVDSIRILVAYANQLMNETLVESLQESMVFDEGQFLENYLKISLNDYVREYEKFGQDMSDSYWEISSLTTESNAFYMLQFNAIVIYAGIMMLRFYDTNRVEYLNIGALGSLIGHEITHAFDPQGSQFDALGNKLRATWWDERTLIGFERNQKCFVDKYDNLPLVPGQQMLGQKLNSTFTLGENMADNGGFQIAHQVYRQWVEEERGKTRGEILLPGLNFTQDQLFWLSLASIWCNHDDSSINSSTMMGKIDSHSPAKYRVNIPLSNAKQFSEAFHCQAGTFMNPSEKCVVW